MANVITSVGTIVAPSGLHPGSQQGLLMELIKVDFDGSDSAVTIGSTKITSGDYDLTVIGTILGFALGEGGAGVTKGVISDVTYPSDTLTVTQDSAEDCDVYVAVFGTGL